MVNRGDPKTALGSDAWRPRDWQPLPEEGLATLTALLNSIEIDMRWPTAAWVNLVVFLGKDPKEHKERPITLTSGIYRLWGGHKAAADSRLGPTGTWTMGLGNCRVLGVNSGHLEGIHSRAWEGAGLRCVHCPC